MQRPDETRSTLLNLAAGILSGRFSRVVDRTALSVMLEGLRALQVDNRMQPGRNIAWPMDFVRSLLEAGKNVRSDGIRFHVRDQGEDIRKQFVQLRSEKSTLPVQAAVATKKGMDWTVFSILGSSVVCLAVLLVVCLRLRREMRRRREAQAKTGIYAAERDDLYNQAPCGYHSIDEESGLIMQMNDTELAWLGYTREQVIGKLKQADLLTPESAERYRLEVRPRFQRDKSISNVELDYRRADGTHFSVLMSAGTARHPDTGQVLSRNMICDISARKRMEREMDALNAEIRRHAQHLSNVNKELESFSYSVSHDLRAPLRAISGYAMMVEEDYAQALDEKGRELLQVISKNVRKMDGLINDLLRLSRSSTVELKPVKVPTREVVEHCIMGLRREYGNVEFIVGPLDDVIANRALLTEVWENLLGNAAKFSSRQARPEVRVSATQTPDEVVFQVSDNGVGFDMRYVHKLFGTFQRLHRQDDFPGSGIGLALVQRIVVRHDGRVWAESVQGEGASFYFSLPKTRADLA